MAFPDVFQLAVQTFNTDLSSGASKAQLRQDLQAVDTALQDLVRAETKFVLDLLADQAAISPPTTTRTRCSLSWAVTTEFDGGTSRARRWFQDEKGTGSLQRKSPRPFMDTGPAV